jgi:hypothetical protein
VGEFKLGEGGSRLAHHAGLPWEDVARERPSRWKVQRDSYVGHQSTRACMRLQAEPYLLFPSPTATCDPYRHFLMILSGRNVAVHRSTPGQFEISTSSRCVVLTVTCISASSPVKRRALGFSKPR